MAAQDRLQELEEIRAQLAKLAEPHFPGSMLGSLKDYQAYVMARDALAEDSTVIKILQDEQKLQTECHMRLDKARAGAEHDALAFVMPIFSGCNIKSEDLPVPTQAAQNTAVATTAVKVPREE